MAGPREPGLTVGSIIRLLTSCLPIPLCEMGARRPTVHISEKRIVPCV